MSDEAPNTRPRQVVTLAPTPPAVTEAPLASEDEPSGVRHVLLRNEPGVLREACARAIVAQVPLNRCS